MSVVANVAINVDSRGATQQLRAVQQGAQATSQAFNLLSSAAAAFGAGFALSKVIADVKELDTNLRRLNTVGVDVGKISPALAKLNSELTMEELLLWSAYFELSNDEQEAAMRRRR